MKYGFVIDNRKCIGCHACTVACKSEHDVPIGVNRTWVKQVEKGTFPNTRRLFSVMRCNHCTDAPCVEICPVEALYIRPDGIVDFDNNRCIGCKSCMQACPYDVLYIDPDTRTAAKCNYCAHRIDIGLEPACVNVCPEHAIISGDMDNPNSEIAHLLASQPVSVRKPEKGTQPNVFYINADEVSLNPSATQRSEQYMWSSQAAGVGHYAKYIEERKESKDLIEMALELAGDDNMEEINHEVNPENVKKSVELLMQKGKRVYDAPKKGILWGQEVATYIWTKAISAGVFLVLFLAFILGYDFNNIAVPGGFLISLVTLLATTFFLVKDLDQPTRFLYVLLRPQWKSWLVKGGYSLTFFGLFLTLWFLAYLLNWPRLILLTFLFGAFFAFITAVYTAFLFAQAKGRDFWQSPALALHMLVHSLLCGAAALILLSWFGNGSPVSLGFLRGITIVSLLTNLLVMTLEMVTPHPTEDAKRTAHAITSGIFSKGFWYGVILVGNLLPLFILIFTNNLFSASVASILILAGSYIAEQIWVYAPQRVSLS